jgi:hypothetical protein
MSMIITHGIMGSALQISSGRNTSPLSQIAGIGAVIDLDATLTASYPGTGQTWSNIIASPADGAGQTDYDMVRGSSSSASTDDPAFNGTANDPAAYWSFDGGDYLSLASGTNTSFLNGLHKTTGGSPVTIIIAFKAPSSYNATGAFFATGTASSAEGLEMRITSGAANQMIQRAASTNGISTPFTATPSTAAVHLMAMAFDYGTTSLKTALDARSFTSKTLTLHTTSASASNALKIGASGSAGDLLPNTTQIFGFYTFNKMLSDSELSGVIDVLNSRHNRTYA